MCKTQEEEYRHSQEPRYRHLNDDLHVEITAYAAPAEAHARIALALTEIRRFLVPVGWKREKKEKKVFLLFPFKLIDLVFFSGSEMDNTRFPACVINNNNNGTQTLPSSKSICCVCIERVLELGTSSTSPSFPPF